MTPEIAGLIFLAFLLIVLALAVGLVERERMRRRVTRWLREARHD